MVGVNSTQQNLTQPAPSAQSAAQMSFAEYLLLPHTEERCEFVDGRIVKMIEPTLLHIRIIKHLTALFDQYFKDQQLDFECYGGPGVQVPRTNPPANQQDRVRDPDLIVATRARWQKVASQTKAVFLQGNMPNLVVEVCSPSTVGVDLGDKVTEYASAGIQEYWIVNPLADYVRVYQLVGDVYQMVCECKNDDLIVSPTLKRLSLTANAAYFSMDA
ncbi:MAG: Uma2 family endonuclease [Phormidesmis sp.]